MTDDRTANLDLPLPSPANLLQDDVPRLRQALQAIDSAWTDKADLVSGKIPTAQLPSYVDDVLEFDSLAAFPADGENGKIYVDLATDKTYRWSGSTYVVLSDFELLPATAARLGGVKIGFGLVVDSAGVVGIEPGALQPPLFEEVRETPTTLAGYGITDAVPKSGGTMTGPLVVPSGATGTQAINASGVDTKIANKADKGTTLAAYGITNAVPTTGGRFTGGVQFPHTQRIGYPGDPGGLKIGGVSNDSCGMTFHRSSYAINFGLDSDNVIRLGGWSQGDNAYRISIDAAGNFAAAGNVTAYSDRRLKKDLKKIEGALDKIKQLNGYTFTRKDTGERQTGLVAQELRDVLPEAVQDVLGTLTVAYGNLAGLFAEAIKELDGKIEELKARGV